MFEINITSDELKKSPHQEVKETVSDTKKFFGPSAGEEIGWEFLADIDRMITINSRWAYSLLSKEGSQNYEIGDGINLLINKLKIDETKARQILEHYSQNLNIYSSLIGFLCSKYAEKKGFNAPLISSIQAKKGQTPAANETQHRLFISENGVIKCEAILVSSLKEMTCKNLQTDDSFKPVTVRAEFKLENDGFKLEKITISSESQEQLEFIKDLLLKPIEEVSQTYPNYPWREILSKQASSSPKVLSRPTLFNPISGSVTKIEENVHTLQFQNGSEVPFETQQISQSILLKLVKTLLETWVQGALILLGSERPTPEEVEHKFKYDDHSSFSPK